MKKRYFFKRICAAVVAILIASSVTGSGIFYPALAEETGYDDTTTQQNYDENTQNQGETGSNDWIDNPVMEGGDNTTDYSQAEQTDGQSSDSQNTTQQNNQASDDDSSQASETDENSESDDSTASLNEYTQKLRELAIQQAELDKQIKEAGKELKNQTAKTKAIKKKINSLNNEINVLNGYMTALEIKINTNKRNIEEKKQEIEEGKEDFKQRLRAMYIAGSDSYATMVLESDSFYDALMRMELVKRVAEHDNSTIDNLVQLKKQYEESEKELDKQQAEYEKQSKLLDNKKKKLEELYNTNEDTRKQLARKKKALDKQNKDFQSQRSDFAGLLKNSTGNTPRDQQVKATMALADEKLKQLHSEIAEKKRKGKLKKGECQYTFAWPVPQSYNITYGIGARWGAYHAGLDIGGDHGYKIKASESGTVIRVNTVCPHDYGKSGSCGCGGGYGKYIIIDHGNDFITLYGHLSEVDVLPGDKVKEGDVIGKMGSTGFSTGDHLHFEIRYQGYILNPAFYVDIK